MNIYTNDNAAGGWTEHDTVARRLCTELWKATGAFAKITDYHADVVLDYMIVLAAVEALEPGTTVAYLYSVGDNGTHFAFGPTEAHAKAIMDYNSGPATAKFAGTISRSDWNISEYGQRWGANKYGLTIDSLLPSEVVQQD